MFEHEKARGMLCLSSDGRRVLVTRPKTDRSSENQVALGEMAHPPRFFELTDVGRDVSCGAISRDGTWSVTADYEHDLMLWELDRAVSTAPQDEGPDWRGLRFGDFSDDGGCAVFGIESDKPLVFNLKTEAVLEDPTAAAGVVTALRKRLETERPNAAAAQAPDWMLQERGHAAHISGLDIACHGLWDASVSEDGTVRVWDRRQSRQLAVFSDETIFFTCRWSADGLTLAATDHRDRTHLLRLEGVERPPGTSASTV
jgi:WD40 repeat protein